MQEVVDFVKTTLTGAGVKVSDQQLTDVASTLTAEAASEASSEATSEMAAEVASEVASETAAESASESALEAGSFQGFGRR